MTDMQNPELECRTDAKGGLIPASRCPACSYEMDAATCVDENGTKRSRPKPGDVSVCIKCGAILEYSENMILQPLDLESIDDDDTKFQLRRIQQHIRKPA